MQAGELGVPRVPPLPASAALAEPSIRPLVIRAKKNPLAVTRSAGFPLAGEKSTLARHCERGEESKPFAILQALISFLQLSQICETLREMPSPAYLLKDAGYTVSELKTMLRDLFTNGRFTSVSGGAKSGGLEYLPFEQQMIEIKAEIQRLSGQVPANKTYADFRTNRLDAY